MQHHFSLRVTASDERPLQALGRKQGAIDHRPMQWKRTAVLLAVGVAAVCLLTPAAAWAKGASSSPSYSFPAAARGTTPSLSFKVSSTASRHVYSPESQTGVGQVEGISRTDRKSQYLHKIGGPCSVRGRIECACCRIYNHTCRLTRALLQGSLTLSCTWTST